MRTIVREYLAPFALGLLIAAGIVYMIMHPSSCRYEEVC